MKTTLRLHLIPLSRTLALLAIMLAGITMATAPARAGLLSDDGSTGLLPADQALRLQSVVADNGHLIVGWQLANGCYLYLSSLALEVDGKKLPITPVDGTPEWIDDPERGHVQVFRGDVRLRSVDAVTTTPANATVRYQGCAEGRVCYPPKTVTVPVYTQD